MPQIVEMRSLIGPQLFTFDRAVDGPFCFYAAVDRDRANTIFPLIDRRRIDAKHLGRGIPTAQQLDHFGKSFVRGHSPESKALLSNNQALLRKSADNDTPPMESALDLAKRLRIGQAKSGVSDTEIAAACKVSAQAVGQWKKNGRVHKRHLATIAGLFGKSLDWLLGNSEMENNALEQELLLEFRALPHERQQIAIRQIKSLREPYQDATVHRLHEPKPPAYGRKGKPVKKPLKGNSKAGRPA